MIEETCLGRNVKIEGEVASSFYTFCSGICFCSILHIFVYVCSEHKWENRHPDYNASKFDVRIETTHEWSKTAAELSSTTKASGKEVKTILCTWKVQNGNTLQILLGCSVMTSTILQWTL